MTLHCSTLNGPAMRASNMAGAAPVSPLHAQLQQG